jgi:hypothetical protein
VITIPGVDYRQRKARLMVGKMVYLQAVIVDYGAQSANLTQKIAATGRYLRSRILDLSTLKGQSCTHAARPATLVALH